MNEQRRLLSYTEAAIYCGMPRSTFKTRCPLQPVRLDERSKPKLDVKDLDNWIDSIKSGVKEEGADDEIIGKL